MKRQTLTYIRYITLTCSDHVLYHIMFNSLDHAISTWQLECGVWQFRIKRPAVYKSKLLFLSSFSHSTDQRSTYTLRPKNTENLQNHQVQTKQTEQKNAENTSSRQLVTDPGQTRSSCAMVSPQNARPMLYKSTETRKAKHEAVHRRFTRHWRKQFPWTPLKAPSVSIDAPCPSATIKMHIML
ncbi:unnamed protein product [Sphacelaria rigidula]